MQGLMYIKNKYIKYIKFKKNKLTYEVYSCILMVTFTKDLFSAFLTVYPYRVVNITLQNID